MQTIKDDFIEKSKNAHKYYTEINNEIIMPLNELMQENINAQKTLELKWKNAYGVYENKRSKVDIAYAEYMQTFTEFEKNMEMFDKKGSELAPDKKDRITKRINKMLLKWKESEKNYKQQISLSREANKTFQENIAEILSEYQKIEENRVEKIKNCLEIYYKKENSYRPYVTLSSHELVINQISKEFEISLIINEISKIKHISLIEDPPFNRAVSKYNKILQKFEDYYIKGLPIDDFPLENARMSPTNLLSTEPLNEKEQIMQNSIINAVASSWDGNVLQPSELEAFKENMKEIKGRKFFAEALNLYRKNGIFSMKETGFSLIINLLCIALDKIEKDLDIENALNLMILSQTFYCEKVMPASAGVESKTEKMYLQSGIQHYEFWRKKELWEKAIEILINEELQNTQILKESNEDKDIRISNIIFAKLGTVGHNMLIFGVSKEITEEIILNYAKLKNLSESQQNFLKVFLNYLKNNRKVLKIR